GCEGWDWDSVLPFFKKAENQERGADEHHGTGGPLNVSNPVRCPLGDAMVEAAVQAGIPANDDFNGPRQEGAGYYQTTTSSRRRWSAARAYLRDSRRRPNLNVATKAHATRVLIENGRAVGVEYRTPQGLFTARCRGEIVRGDPRLDQPDLQIKMFGWGALERLRTGIKPHPFSAFTLSPVHLRPEGRGTVRIKSPDPLAPPAIQFNFLASDYDFQALIYGTRLSRKIAAQPALKPFVVEEVLPGPAVQTDDDIIEEIRVRGVSNLHPVGTCRMGRETDAVVDPRLKVYGVEGLRVADASIMPQVPGGNTNAPSIMIGEKCAHMILEDARAA